MAQAQGVHIIESEATANLPSFGDALKELAVNQVAIDGLNKTEKLRDFERERRELERRLWKERERSNRKR